MVYSDAGVVPDRGSHHTDPCSASITHTDFYIHAHAHKAAYADPLQDSNTAFVADGYIIPDTDKYADTFANAADGNSLITPIID